MMVKGTQHVVLKTAVPVVVTYVFWLYWCGRRKKNPKEKIHVDYPHPRLPFAVRVIAMLPRFLRRPMMIKGSVPQPPLDGIDLLLGGQNDGANNHDPYEFKELVPNKVWRVRYRYVADPKLIDALRTLFGIALSDRSILDNIPDDDIRKHVEHHMDCAAQLAAKNQGLDVKEQQLNTLLAGCEDSQDMLVARLMSGTTAEDGGLLLYNPCRMHPQVVDYVKSLGGTVRYIVSGSSVHTNQIPQAVAAYKDAKIILAESAELKCTAAGMRPADFIYSDHDPTSNPRSYRSAVAELEEYGVQLFHVAGDVQTQTLVVIAHDHLFDTDLTCYGNGHRWLYLDQVDWENPTAALNFAQTLYYAAISNSVVPGYLPNYRLMAMDPSSPFAKLMLDEPTVDSCKQMAESLRQMLKLKFSWVDNVHSKKQESLPASEFKRCVNQAWNWLDGNSLL